MAPGRSRGGGGGGGGGGYQQQAGGGGKPGFSITEMSKSHIKFVLRNVDLSIANALRRVLLMEVPTIAIDLVSVMHNTSVLNDEMLAHRFGLVPLVSTRVAEMCTQHEAEEDEDFTDVTLSLQKRNTSTSDSMAVTSDDFKLDDKHRDICPVNYRSTRGTRTNPNVRGGGGGGEDMMDVDMGGGGGGGGGARGGDDDDDDDDLADKKPVLLCKLRPGQEIDVECVARKGIGKDHAKFSPVATATFTTVPIIHLNHSMLAGMSHNEKLEWVESCPTDVFKVDGITGEIEVVNPEAYGYDRECIIKAEEMGKPGLVEITEALDEFVFTVETTGVLEPDRVVRDALAILRKKLDAIRSAVHTAASLVP